MKRKPLVSAQQSQPVSAAPDCGVVSAQSISIIDRTFVYIFPLLLFLGMTVQNTVMSLILAALALVLSLGKGLFHRFSGKLILPVFGFLVFLILNMAASLYSGFGAYAYSEFSKILAAGSLGILLLTRGRKEHARRLLWGFSAICAVISLLCLDLACNGPLFNSFSNVMSFFGSSSYAALIQDNLSASARINGIYNNANISGSLFALAVLVGIYLIHTSSVKGKRMLAALLTGVSSVGFLSSMSRGAFLCFAVSLLVYLLAEKRETRLPLFFSMLATVIAMVIFGLLSTFLLSQKSLLGTWIALPTGILLFLLDEYPGKQAGTRLRGHGKVIGASIGVFLVICAAGVWFLVNATKPYTFTEGVFLDRNTTVVSGQTYTLSGESESLDQISVRITAANREQELQGISEELYRGPLDQATFTVPYGVSTVYFRFWASDGVVLNGVSLSDGTEIPMAYSYLPESWVVRLQGNLLESSSFLLRIQYVKDGLALFVQSPLIGHGLGATEGLLTSVQPFFYESLYVHNHLIQVLDETGILGLAAFLALILGTIWILLRRIRLQQDPLAAVLLSCVVMMNLHGLMEITFSVRVFQCTAFFLMLLVVVCFAQPAAGKKNRVLGIVGLFAASLWLIASSVLLGSSWLAQREYASLDVSGMTVSSFMETMEKLDRMDAYTDQDIKVNLMGNALQQGGTLNEGTASRCARELRATGDFDACYKTAAYYYLPLRNLPEFFACVQEGLAQERSNPEAWNSAFDLYRQAFAQLDESNTEDFVSGVLDTGEQLRQANEVLTVDIALDEMSESLLNACSSIQEQQMESSEAYIMLSLLLTSES